LLDEMLEHRKAHAADAHDPNARFLPVHWCPLSFSFVPAKF
jgi:hypothetical protein